MLVKEFDYRHLEKETHNRHFGQNAHLYKCKKHPFLAEKLSTDFLFRSDCWIFIHVYTKLLLGFLY